MKKLNRKSLLVAGLLALVAVPTVLVPLAYAAGLFGNFPIVGGASFCASTNTAGVPGTTAVCTNTVPAGPTRVTGAELVPADTELAQGQAPQTVTINSSLLAAGSHATFAPLTGASILIPNNINNVLIVPAGTIANLAVTMPTAPKQGHLVRISSSATVTALALSASAGQTLSNAPTAITISTTGSYGYAFIYMNTTWYRIQ